MSHKQYSLLLLLRCPTTQSITRTCLATSFLQSETLSTEQRYVIRAPNETKLNLTAS